MPSYVGSKRQWVDRLRPDLDGRHLAELFCGSAVLSANLASSALLVDLDPKVHLILSRFDEQIVPEVFTRADYYALRKDPEWWKHAFCLQAISYSGVFRYSEKSGYNVPAKGGADPKENKTNEWRLRPMYEEALTRWQNLTPTVVQDSYLNVTADMIEATLGPDAVVILDPPYEGSQAAYNVKFDYKAYWDRVDELRERFTTVVFDRASNLEAHGLTVHATRKMRVNGARPGDEEGMAIECPNDTFSMNTDPDDLFTGSGITLSA